MGDETPHLVAGDLFLGLSAILLAVFTIIAVGMHMQRAPVADAVADLAAQAGRPVAEADAAGLRLFTPGAPMREVTRDALLDEGALQGWPGAVVPLVVLDPDAGDTAFLFESALARAGVARIDRLRLGGACASLLIEGGQARCTGP